MVKPLILISNDDGITSKGIRFLVEEAHKIGDVIVVAPDSPQSAMGHAITMGNTLRIRENDIFDSIETYECSGTPADCIKLAQHHIIKDRKVDLVLSGVNHGSNSSINVIYSGTMSAALEGAIEGLPSIGFSLCDYDPDASLAHTQKYIHLIINKVLANGLPKGVALNVNFPTKRREPIQGIKICRQAHATWEEQFDVRKDPFGRDYFWMVGNFVSHDKEQNNDEWALANNYVSIVPCQYDMTAHQAIPKIKQEWNLIEKTK